MDNAVSMQIGRRSFLLAAAALKPAAAAGFSTAAAEPPMLNPLTGTYLGTPEDEGYGASPPALESRLIDLVSYGGSFSDEVAAKFVYALEGRGGPELNPSAFEGTYVMPWVGAWRNIWSNMKDFSYFGGPTTDRFRNLKTLSEYKLESARHFIYGPGNGGVTVEYLHSAPGEKVKRLLTRAGSVTNLGNRICEFDFPTRLLEFETITEDSGQDQLASSVQLLGGTERDSPAPKRLLKTTYLSPTLWILRDVRPPQKTRSRKLVVGDKVFVFQRTNARAVVDQRGLVVDNQLKPPEDDSIRYGRLLFSESNYEGWDGQQAKV
jgi:hypothetical protein